MSTKQTITAATVRALLRERYGQPAWAFFEEVRNKTGAMGDRYVDALALSLWPSNGLDLVGFEIKVSRSDWLRELKDPSKANAFQRWCDRWFVVAPEGIVHRIELPSRWGLLEVVTNKGRLALRLTVEAPALEPEPLGKPFIASIVRGLHKDIEENITSRVNERWQAERRKADESKLEVETTLRDEATKAAKKFYDLCAAIGLEPYQFDAARAESLKRLKLAMELTRDPGAMLRRLSIEAKSALAESERAAAKLHAVREQIAALEQEAAS